jgi:hypothetical protein
MTPGTEEPKQSGKWRTALIDHKKEKKFVLHGIFLGSSMEFSALPLSGNCVNGGIDGEA